MKKLTFSVVAMVLIFCTALYSQNEKNIWYFGNYAGIDFNSGGPVSLFNSVMMTYDNCTSVSDQYGDLLFYSNGLTVWNKHHLPMPNGQGLLGHTSCTNGALAVKQPGRTDVYYLFTNDAFAGPSGLRYSVIDMSLDGGNGDVTSMKNIPLLIPNTEKTLAVYHENNINIWIIAHAWNSNAFYAYLLTSTGLDTNAVISHVGSYHTGGTFGTYNAMGQISALPDGSKIGLAIYDFQQYELFDFDNSVGILSNPIVIPGFPNAWGVEFSPDGSKMYTTRWKFSPVYQFDISSNNATTIINSMVQVGEATSPDPQYDAGFLQLGPDGKIYIAKYNSEYLASINNPDESGILCNFIDNSIYLGGQLSLAGLPTYIKTETTTGFEDVIGESSRISLFPNPAKDIIQFTIRTDKITNVSISLYSIQGIFIKTLYKGIAGGVTAINEINLNLQSPHIVTTGLYFFQIRINDQTITKKIHIIRD